MRLRSGASLPQEGKTNSLSGALRDLRRGGWVKRLDSNAGFTGLERNPGGVEERRGGRFDERGLGGKFRGKTGLQGPKELSSRDDNGVLRNARKGFKKESHETERA